MKVSPSILAGNWANMKSEIKKIEKDIDYIHIDVMDGNFVPNISFGPDITKSIKKVTKVPLDVHLMVKRPLDYIEKFIEIGAQIVTIHYETINKKSFDLIWKMTSSAGVKLGIAINPDTPYEVIIPYLEKIDLILVMSVNPGFYGQEFIEDVTYKIDCLRDLIKSEKLNILLEIDGGINNKTLKYARKCDIIVSGSYIFEAENPQEIVKKIKK